MLSRIRGLKIIYPNALYHDDIGLQLWSCSSRELTNCSWLDLAQCVLKFVEWCPSHQPQFGMKCLWEEEIWFSLGLSLADFDTLLCTECRVNCCRAILYSLFRKCKGSNFASFRILEGKPPLTLHRRSSTGRSNEYRYIFLQGWIKPGTQKGRAEPLNGVWWIRKGVWQMEGLKDGRSRTWEPEKQLDGEGWQREVSQPGSFPWLGSVPTWLCRSGWDLISVRCWLCLQPAFPSL